MTDRPQLQEGAALKANSLYVRREADEQVFAGLRHGESHYVMAPRMTGKSSLVRRVVPRLNAVGIRSAEINLNSVGSKTAEVDLWYASLSREVASQLGLAAGWEDWWRGAPSVPVHAWSRFLREVVLTRVSEPVVLFIDEIDDLLSLPFSSDDFFASLRAVHTDRASNPELERLTFCLLGSHPPASLMREPTRTPLQVATAVFLEDFSLEQMSEFLPAISHLLPNAELVLARVYEWTSGHPYMTQRLLVGLLRRDRFPASRIGVEVNDIANRLFLRSGCSVDACLFDAARRLVTDEPGVSAFAKLEMYEQLLQFADGLDSRGAPDQLALRLAGVAAERREQGGSTRLRVRNQVVSLVFDQAWVAQQRGQLPTQLPSAAPAQDPDDLRSASLLSMDRLVQRLFCDPRTAISGPYQRLGDGEELLQKTLFRYSLQSSHDRVSLQVFKGIAGVGGELWEQEVRALVRLSARRHPALPQIVEGDFHEAEDMAFVLTLAARYTLAYPGAMESLRARRLDALRQLALLADGLVQLHGNGLLHRNIHPDAIEVLNDPDDGLRLRFARFEVGSLIANLLRRVARLREEDRGQDEAVRQLLKRQGSQALACTPPERLALIFETHGREMFEGPQIDVFGLGVVAYQWFVGPLPEAALARTFPGGATWDPDEQQGLIREMHRCLRAAALPAPLVEIIEGMTNANWRTRLTSAEAVTAIAAKFEEISEFFSSADDRLSHLNHLLTYLPIETGTLLRTWGILEHDPSTPPGREELRAFIAGDLRHALLTFSSQGFAPYVPGGGSSDARPFEARYVLIGDRAAYFAATYEHRLPWQRWGGQPVPEVLMIRYVTDRRRVWRLERNAFTRRVPALDLVAPNAQELESGKASGRPSWEPLLRSVELEKTPPWQVTMDQALDWLLRFERARLLARTYAVKVEQQVGLSYVLMADPERDQRFIWADALRALYARDTRRRPRLGDFFDQEADEDFGDLLFLRDNAGAPVWSDNRPPLEVRFEQTLDPGRIRVKLAQGIAGESLPQIGWIQISEDQGTRNQVERQERARLRLLEMPGLVDQLFHPAASVHLRSRWPDAGKGLAGNAPQIVREMLDSWPFFALHGPPGTGKTTVAAHAVEQSLRRDGSQRILISAQSHYALDNLAERILDRLGSDVRGDVIALRIAARGSEGKVSPRTQRLLPAQLTQDRIRLIEEACSNRLHEAEDEPALLQIIARWRAAAPRSALELQARLRRGANLLFCTAGTATDRSLGTDTYSDICDWVIVEEAAKAWPTELAMPLVQGLRWTLIGDHLQLDAFNREEVEAVLQECGMSEDEELLAHHRNREAYTKVFRLFGSLFDSAVDDGGDAEGIRKGACRRPVQVLSTQFRMRREIADVVSEAFYQDVLKTGHLETHPSADRREHGFSTPGWLGSAPLVWVDTTGIVEARDEPRWRNRAEADILVRIVRSLRPGTSREPIEHRLAVLSPYLAQVQLLRDKLRTLHLDHCVHTVDSFQGREADVVLVSLVRYNDRRTALARLGFLTRPERINVLFSRGRCLLLIVGSFTHFYDSGGTFWSTACDGVLRHGTRISAAAAGLVDFSGEAP